MRSMAVRSGSFPFLMQDHCAVWKIANFLSNQLSREKNFVNVRSISIRICKNHTVLCTLTVWLLRKFTLTKCDNFRNFPSHEKCFVKLIYSMNFKGKRQFDGIFQKIMGEIFSRFSVWKLSLTLFWRKFRESKAAGLKLSS